MSGVIDIVNNPSDGLLDEFGTGEVVNNAAAYFALPSELATLPQDGWSVVQWGQPIAISPDNYLVNSPSTYEALYGDALYAWSEPSATSAISLYQNTNALGGGDVIQLTDGNTLLPPSGLTDEADMFLTSPNITPSDGNLAHPITLTLNAKIIQSLTNFVNSETAETSATDGLVFSNIDIGFTINFNGADGLPGYSGFVQIVPWTSDSAAQASYESSPISPTYFSQFVSSLLIGNDSELSILPSDASANPETLTYNINKYVYQTLTEAFSRFTPAQQAVLLNLGNWSIGSMFIGLATNDQLIQNPTNSNQTVNAAKIASTVQLSDINLTSDPNATYNPASPPTSVSAIDVNPKILFYDNTMSVSGSADGGSYAGTVPGIQDKYIYGGDDSILLTAPAGSNWYFGGGSALTGLTATSGNNVFLASTGSSFMIGGTGSDTFDIPDANLTDIQTWDTIVNFHVGDSISLAGLAGPGWTYSWQEGGGAGNTGLTLDATSTTNAGLAELVTFSGLGFNDLAHMTIAPDQATGTLDITSNDNSLETVLPFYDVTSGQCGWEIASLAEDQTTAINKYIYAGSDKMNFSIPAGDGDWEVGGGSALSGIFAPSGNNTLIASTGSSFMTGGSGDNNFVIPAATLTGTQAWDTITDLHPGDIVTLTDIFGPDWKYSFRPDDMGAVGSTGLTLEATNTTIPGLVESLTFSNLNAGDSGSLMLSQGTGSNSNNLVVSMT